MKYMHLRLLFIAFTVIIMQIGEVYLTCVLF